MAASLFGGDTDPISGGVTPFFMSDRAMQIPGQHITAISAEYMRQIWEFSHSEPVVCEVMAVIARLSTEGGVAVNWTATGAEKSFRNVRSERAADGDSQTDDELALLDVLISAMRWRLMFGFVPIQMPGIRTATQVAPKLRAPRANRGPSQPPAEGPEPEISRQNTDDAPPPNYEWLPTAGVVPRWEADHGALPQYVRDALRSASATQAAPVEHMDRDMSVPLVPSFGTGVFLRVEDTVSSERFMVYLPNYLRAGIQSAQDMQRHIESGLYSVFVWPGCMPSIDGRIVSAIAPLLYTRHMLTVLEAAMVDAEVDAAHPAIIHQEVQTGAARGANDVFVPFGDALAAAAGRGGTAVSSAEVREQRVRRYAESRDSVNALSRELARRRRGAHDLGGVDAAASGEMLRDQRRAALEAGATVSTRERLAQRLFALPGSEQLAGAGPQARTWQNVLEHRAVFEDSLYAALGIPRAYAAHGSSMAGASNVADTLTVTATVRATVKNARDDLVRFFNFAYDVTNRQRDSEYIGQMLMGLQTARRSALDALDEHSRRQLEAPDLGAAPTVLERILDRQEQMRREIEDSIRARAEPFRRAQRAPRTARLVFRRMPMLTLAELQFLAESGTISEREEIMMTRSAMQINNDTCPLSETRSIPVDVMARKRRREEERLPPPTEGGGKAKPKAKAAASTGGSAVKKARKKIDSVS